MQLSEMYGAGRFNSLARYVLADGQNDVTNENRLDSNEDVNYSFFFN